jgi:hypothetical protein
MLRVVVHLGEMRYYQHLQPFMGKLVKQSERFLVGNMAMTGFDAPEALIPAVSIRCSV